MTIVDLIQISMKLVTQYLLIALALSLLAFASDTLSEWSIADDYEVKFSGSGAEGTFQGLRGTIIFDSSAPEQAQFNIILDATTIDTGNKTKNKHARGDSWFDVEHYPEIRFRSTQVKALSDSYQMIGMLTLHGIKKEISFPFTFTQSSDTGLFKGSFTVDREKYGIKGPLLGFLVGDDFEVNLSVPVKK